MKEILKKEIARDFIALGSIPFFVLVLIRIYILGDISFFSKLIFSGVIFLSLMFLFKQNMYSGLGIIALIFTSLYYNDLKFSIFVSLVYLGLLMSLFYLKKDKKSIISGVVFGIISSLISYYVVMLIIFK